MWHFEMTWYYKKSSNLIHCTEILSPGRFAFAAAALVGLSFLRSPRRDQQRWKTWKCIVGGRMSSFGGYWLPDRFTQFIPCWFDFWECEWRMESCRVKTPWTLSLLNSGNGRSWMWVSAFDAWYLRGNEMMWTFGHGFNGSWDVKTTSICSLEMPICPIP